MVDLQEYKLLRDLIVNELETSFGPTFPDFGPFDTIVRYRETSEDGGTVVKLYSASGIVWGEGRDWILLETSQPCESATAALRDLMDAVHRRNGAILRTMKEGQSITTGKMVKF